MNLKLDRQDEVLAKHSSSWHCEASWMAIV